MKHTLIALGLSIPLFTLGGCIASAEDVDSSAPDVEEQGITFNGTLAGGIAVKGGVLAPPDLPPPPPETPTTVTFYANANFTGTSYSVQLNGTGVVDELVRNVPWSEITTAGLSGAMSSVRLTCGSRPSRVSLFDVDWGQFTHGTMLECAANQTATLNLVDAGWDNRINAASLVVHALSSDNKPHSVPFGFLTRSAWNASFPDQLPSGAEADGGGYIWVESPTSFRLQQFLTLDSFWCSERGADFDLRITMSSVNFKPVFKVSILEEYVDYGTGDAWGCHDDMLSGLDSGVHDAAAKLEANLGQNFALIGSPLSSTRYFASEGYTTDFDAFVRIW